MSNNKTKEFYEKYGDAIKELRRDGMMVKDIAKKYNNEVCVSTLSNYLRRNGILVRHELSEEDKYKICQRYLDGEVPKVICKDFHVTSAKITQVVRDMGFQARTMSASKKKYQINENYFDNIDDQNKAYIIGLLLADGSRRSTGHTVSLSLQESDVDILRQICKLTDNHRPITFVNLSKKNPNYSNLYTMFICGDHICNALEKYGIVPRKDFKVKFPSNIDDVYYRHVIRGLLDGDGFICKTECRCGITGNKDLIEFLKMYISSKLDIHCSITIPHKGKDTRDIRISGRRQVKKFLDYIYEDANLYIRRKYDIYKTLYNETTLPQVS